MPKLLSIEERIQLANTAVAMFRAYNQAVLDLANLQGSHPEFMEEHYKFPDKLPGLLKRSCECLETAEDNLMSRKILIL